MLGFEEKKSACSAIPETFNLGETMKAFTMKVVAGTSIALGVAGFATAQRSAPTKGYIPDEAFETRRLDRVPDFVVAYARDGEVAGYVRKTELFGPPDKRSRPIEVLDESLSRSVGHMVPGRGFVPVGTPDEKIPAFEEVPVSLPRH